MIDVNKLRFSSLKYKVNEIDIDDDVRKELDEIMREINILTPQVNQIILKRDLDFHQKTRIQNLDKKIEDYCNLAARVLEETKQKSK